MNSTGDPLHKRVQNVAHSHCNQLKGPGRLRMRWALTWWFLTPFNDVIMCPAGNMPSFGMSPYCSFIPLMNEWGSLKSRLVVVTSTGGGISHWRKIIPTAKSPDCNPIKYLWEELVYAVTRTGIPRLIGVATSFAGYMGGDPRNGAASHGGNFLRSSRELNHPCVKQHEHSTAWKKST